VALVNWPQPQMRKVIELVIKKGVSVNDKTKNGETPLHLCADRNDLVDVMELIIKNGGDFNATDGNGETRK